MTEVLPAELLEYTVVSGVSAGALNASLFSLYAKGEERQLSEELVSVWSTLTNSDVKTDYDREKSIFTRPSFYDDQPLKDKIHARF
jgi:predicted acylesterase/phospholipase RssA